MRSRIGAVTFVGLGLLLWAVLMGLNRLFPEPMTSMTEVVGPVLMVVGTFALILGFGVLWNDHLARRSRPQ